MREASCQAAAVNVNNPLRPRRLGPFISSESSGRETARPALHQSLMRPRVLLQRIGNSIRGAAQPLESGARLLAGKPLGSHKFPCLCHMEDTFSEDVRRQKMGRVAGFWSTPLHPQTPLL